MLRSQSTLQVLRTLALRVSDNALFVRLGQRYEAFSPRSGADRVLLGGSDPVDTVSVEEARGSGSNISAAFTVRLSFTQFQLRMRVSTQARTEFIPCPHETVGFFILIILICLCVRRLYPAFAPLCNVQAVLGSGSSRSALRSLAHPRWMPASASSIGLPHQVTIDAGSFIRGLSDDPARWPTVPLPPVSAASHV
jgi:hypothetical protein